MALHRKCLPTPGVNYCRCLSIAPNKEHCCTCCSNMGIRRIFFKVSQLWNFSSGSQKIFREKAKSGEISFYLLKTKNQPFFTKNVIGKCQISKSREALVLPVFLGYRKDKAFCFHPCAVHHQQFSQCCPPRKKFCRHPCLGFTFRVQV